MLLSILSFPMFSTVLRTKNVSDVRSLNQIPCHLSSSHLLFPNHTARSLTKHVSATQRDIHSSQSAAITLVQTPAKTAAEGTLTPMNTGSQSIIQIYRYHLQSMITSAKYTTRTRCYEYCLCVQSRNNA